MRREGGSLIRQNPPPQADEVSASEPSLDFPSRFVPELGAYGGPASRVSSFSYGLKLGTDDRVWICHLTIPRLYVDNLIS